MLGIRAVKNLLNKDQKVLPALRDVGHYNNEKLGTITGVGHYCGTLGTTTRQWKILQDVEHHYVTFVTIMIPETMLMDISPSKKKIKTISIKD